MGVKMFWATSPPTPDLLWMNRTRRAEAHRQSLRRTVQMVRPPAGLNAVLSPVTPRRKNGFWNANFQERKNPTRNRVCSLHTFISNAQRGIAPYFFVRNLIGKTSRAFLSHRLHFLRTKPEAPC